MTTLLVQNILNRTALNLTIFKTDDIWQAERAIERVQRETQEFFCVAFVSWYEPRKI